MMNESEHICPGCGRVIPIVFCPQCTLLGLAKEEPGSPIDGETVGPEIPGLTIHEEVGEGGFGIVYRATQQDTVRRSVALKILKPGVDTRQVLRRFEIERQALALLEHPNIARFYQAGETEKGYPWFTMELIEGEPISEVFAGRGLMSLIDTFLAVCSAISYAHEKGVIHRDLKPSNILVTPDGIPKVIDFGIAKATGPTPGMTLYTANEIQVGTPAYMAPEGASEGDVKGDVYSLGAILYELLTDTPPSEGAVPAPSGIALRKIPRSLDVIVARATDRDPARRYPTVNALAVDLRRFQNGEEIKAARTWRVKIAMGLVAIFFAAMTFIFWPEKPGEGGKERSVPRIMRHSSAGHPSMIMLNQDGTRSLAVFRVNGRAILTDARAGRELGSVPATPLGHGCGVFTERGDRFLLGHSDGSIRFYSAEDAQPVSPGLTFQESPFWVNHLLHLTVAGEEKPTILATAGATFFALKEEGEIIHEIPLVGPSYRLTVNPARTTAVIGSPHGALNLIDLKTGTRKVVNENTAHIYEIKYAPDGRHFACASYDGTATVWTSEGELVHRLEHTGEVKDLDFSPDGTLLATPSFDSAVRIWEVESGKLLHQLYHGGAVLTVCFSPDGHLLASGGRDDFLRLWNPETGNPVRAPWSCEGAPGRIRFAQGKWGRFNVLVQTWGNEYLTIPLSLLPE